MAQSSWDKLTSIATLGLGRAPVQLDTLWPDSSISHVVDSDDRAFLRAAAAAYLWQAAGARTTAQSSSEHPAPSHVEPSEQVSEAAAWRLARMLAGDRADLVPEWLAAAHEQSLVLPAHWLPVVFDALPRELRQRFNDVWGPLGAWLASQNARWSFRGANAEPSEARWTTGTLQERTAELKNMRSIDPRRAREWVQSSWSSDPPDARETFLRIFLDGLCADDEPLLEQALDDKRKGVRMAAAECLSRLGESAHAKRNLARVAPLIELEIRKTGLLSGLRRRKLEVRLPDVPDKAAQRDGIELKPPAARKVGERVFWLMQMVAMSPPRHWTQRFDCDATTLIDAALATDYGDELLSALTEATMRHPNAEWLNALSATWLDRKADSAIIVQSLSALLAAADADQRAPLLEAQLRTLDVNRFDVTSGLLQATDLRWSPTVTRLAIEQLSDVIRNQRQQWSFPRNALDSWARRADVETALGILPSVLDKCPAESPWRNALEHMNETVEFRAAMLKELRRDR